MNMFDFGDAEGGDSSWAATEDAGCVQESDGFDRKRRGADRDANGASSTGDETISIRQQQLPRKVFPYSPPQHFQQQSHHHHHHHHHHQQQQQQQQQQAPLAYEFLPLHQSRQDLSYQQDCKSTQPKRMTSSIHLSDEAHRSMSPLEQQHSIDTLLAKELNQLGFRERNEINEEIHGVISLYAVNETPEFISQSLKELKSEIENNVPMYRKVAYERSQQIYERNLQQQRRQQPCVVSSSVDISNVNSSSSNNNTNPQSSNGYVNDPDFLLMFLRRDLFKIRKAALHLVNFMELVYELWGEIALTKKTWHFQSHLDPFELDVLRTGAFQCLQGRDRAGRRILANFAIDNSEMTLENRLRLTLYYAMSVLEEVETQKKGIVGISVWHNVSIDDFRARGQCHKRMSDSVPIRFSALHCCLPHENSFDSKASNARQTPNPQLLRLIKAMYVMSIGAENRPHLRVHVGSIVECMYALQSFGILPEQIPINATTEKVKTKFHLKWLDLKLQKEKALIENKPFNKIECPMIKDVLFGRGWPIMKHPGNVMLRNIINFKLEEYQNEKTKRGKTLIAYSVVCMIKQKGIGGKFLKEDSGWWVEVSNDMARQKVSIAFRDARKLKSNQSSSGSQESKPTQEKADSAGSPFTTKRKGYMASKKMHCELENDSSTSAFLAMDGITGIKKQRCFGN